MSSVLNPSFQTMSAIRQSIQNILKTDIAPEVMPSIVAPLLISVNQWASQIPAVLDGTGSAASVNLVFAIRSDLFVPPRFSTNVFNIPLAELPAPFQEFMAFIYKLIEAQKTDKEKSVPKVRLLRDFLFCAFFLSYLSLLNVLVVSSSPNHLSMIMTILSKPFP